MITLKEFMEVVDYRITEGSNYMWDCYGPNSYSLDSWNGEQEGHSFTIIFDTKTQVVYEVQSHDYRTQRAFEDAILSIKQKWKSKQVIEMLIKNKPGMM